MILVFGKSGQVATELARLGENITCIGSHICDLGLAGNAQAAIETHRPTAVINAAAYTAVDKAEEDEARATQINGVAVGEIAQTCARLGLPLVHISTDYVFEGSGTAPWMPQDVTGPLGAYGRSKLAGEQAVVAAGGAYAILRTSWVVSAHGNNFVKTMLRLGAERDALTIVADQIGGPTSATDIARACLEIAQQLQTDPNKGGTYHFSGAPDCSWADFARAIFAQAGLKCDVTDIPSSAYPTPAIRPLNSRMNCESLNSTFNIPRPDWRLSLQDILNELNNT